MSKPKKPTYPVWYIRRTKNPDDVWGAERENGDRVVFLFCNEKQTESIIKNNSGFQAEVLEDKLALLSFITWAAQKGYKEVSLYFAKTMSADRVGLTIEESLSDLEERLIADP